MQTIQNIYRSFEHMGFVPMATVLSLLQSTILSSWPFGAISWR